MPKVICSPVGNGTADVLLACQKMPHPTFPIRTKALFLSRQSHFILRGTRLVRVRVSIRLRFCSDGPKPSVALVRRDVKVEQFSDLSSFSAYSDCPSPSLRPLNLYAKYGYRAMSMRQASATTRDLPSPPSLRA